VNGKPSGRDNRTRDGLVARLIARVGRPLVRRLSDLAHESLNHPGSWRCLELVYRNEPRKLLDRFFLGSRSARGARSRLLVLTQEVRRCIEECAGSHNPVRLITLGSGPGHEVLGSIEQMEGSAAVEAVCVDKDRGALEYGRRLAGRKGLDGCVSYVQGNVLRMEPNGAEHHIAVLSGLLDYFDLQTAVSVLKSVNEQLLPGGIVLVANMRWHRLASTMSVLGNWHLAYREPEELEAVLGRSGYEEVEVWLEPEKVFCIGKGRKPG